MARFFYSLPYWDLTTVPRTRDEWLAWGSCIAKRVAEGFDVETTDGTLEENRDGAFHDHEFYLGIGHGGWDVYTVKDGIFLRTPDIGVRTMGGRVVHLLSCLTGKKLGPDLVARFGARAFVGYEVEFCLGNAISEERLPPPCVEPSSEQDLYTASACDLEIQRQLLRGASVEDAVKASQAKFEVEIERYEVGDRSDWYIADKMARDLFSNMGGQVMYAAEGVPAPPPSLAPGLKFAAAVGTIGVGVALFAKPAVEKMR